MDRARLDMANATESFLSAERWFNAVLEAVEKLGMQSTPQEDTLSPMNVYSVEYRNIFDASSDVGERQGTVQIAGREGTGKGKGKGKAGNSE